MPLKNSQDVLAEGEENVDQKSQPVGGLFPTSISCDSDYCSSNFSITCNAYTKLKTRPPAATVTNALKLPKITLNMSKYKWLVKK